MAKPKFYTVWEGVTPGVYHSWSECLLQIKGYTGAKYKSFNTLAEAEEALRGNYWHYVGSNKTTPKPTPSKPFITEALAVDASCLGNPGKMEYRGVFVETGQELFRLGPLEDGTNNIGEFLAIVHGLAYLKQHQWAVPIYTDSVNALAWVRQKKCKTKLKHTARNAKIFELIERAEAWLRNNSVAVSLLKWETAQWGEIPADFGRK